MQQQGKEVSVKEMAMISIVNSFVGFLLLGILSKEISSLQVGCFDVEREALTKFRSKLFDPSNLLASWDDTEDCCEWHGVTCHNETRYVIQLNLHGGAYSGQIDAALLQIKHLRYLDLGLNSFYGVKIPDFIGSLKELRYLDLSFAGFSGKIPFHLGNLSYLEFLDFSYSGSLYADSVDWIVKMSSLKHLGMGSVNLSMVGSRWFHVISSLSSLQILRIYSASLSSFPPEPSFLNLTQLLHLDLSSNQFHSKFPNWLVNITSLVLIELYENDFYGDISSKFAALPHLEGLYLGYNYNLRVNCSNLFSGSWKNIKGIYLLEVDLYGEIPKSIGNMTTLTTLTLGGNRTTKGFLSPMGNLHNLQTLFLQDFEDSIALKLDWLCSLTNLITLIIQYCRFPGPIPACLGDLSSLKVIRMNNNMLEGVVLEKHFRNLNNLIILDLSSNSLEFHFPMDWVPPFQVVEFHLGSCRLGPQFPLWLQTQKNINYLDISQTSVGNIPLWFWNITFHLYYLNLSMNNSSGSPSYITLLNYTYVNISIDLSYNKFTGPIPFFTNPVQFLDISYNQFSGNIPSIFGKMKGLIILNLSHNNLTGGVPATLANCGSLMVLDLKANHLSGNIPWSSVKFVNIQSLHLEKNKLSGAFPLFLKNCIDLQVLDLSENEFSGSLPSWAGVRLSNLRILQLRSNMFTGTIPELWNLSYLQVFDVSHNRLTGVIPRGITNFAAMRTNRITNNKIGSSYYREKVDVSMNGFVYEYTSTLSLVIALDLSNNKFSGTIPEEVGNLIGLIALNLSGNQFSGKLPQSIGKLHQLINLDLSRNRLSGSIPPAIASLNFLNHLNLSYNNLSGAIPSGNQLDTLNDESIYVGNEGLCGYPLRKECESDGRDQIPVQPFGDEEFEDESEMRWVYAGIAPGFAFGFVSVFGVLLFKRSWRIKYFRFADGMQDWFC